MIPTDDATTLSLLYHINSEPWDNTEAYQAAKDYEVEYKEMAVAGNVLKLPAPSATPLSRLLQARESCGEYRLRRMPAQILSNILSSAYGMTRTQRLDGIGNISLRAAPSAGGLFRSRYTRSPEKSKGLRTACTTITCAVTAWSCSRPAPGSKSFITPC